VTIWWRVAHPLHRQRGDQRGDHDHHGDQLAVAGRRLDRADQGVQAGLHRWLG
jgi:hypothetical protein